MYIYLECKEFVFPVQLYVYTRVHVRQMYSLHRVRNIIDKFHLFFDNNSIKKHRLYFMLVCVEEIETYMKIYICFFPIYICYILKCTKFYYKCMIDWNTVLCKCTIIYVIFWMYNVQKCIVSIKKNCFTIYIRGLLTNYILHMLRIKKRIIKKINIVINYMFRIISDKSARMNNGWTNFCY